jgi:hypothetical protein
VAFFVLIAGWISDEDLKGSEAVSVRHCGIACGAIAASAELLDVERDPIRRVKSCFFSS